MMFAVFFFLLSTQAVVVTPSEDPSDPDVLRFHCLPQASVIGHARSVCGSKHPDCAFYGPTWILDHACDCGMTDAQVQIYCCPPWSNDTKFIRDRNPMTGPIRTYDNAKDETDIPKIHRGLSLVNHVQKVCRKTTPRCTEMPTVFNNRAVNCGLTDNQIARYCCPNELQRTEELEAEISGIPWY